MQVQQSPAEPHSPIACELHGASCSCAVASDTASRPEAERTNIYSRQRWFIPGSAPAARRRVALPYRGCIFVKAM
jgi:hypothetical protein